MSAAVCPACRAVGAHGKVRVRHADGVCARACPGHLVDCPQGPGFTWNAQRMDAGDPDRALQVQIHLRGAALLDDPGMELARMLRRLATRLEDDVLSGEPGQPDERTALLDVNGHRVGWWQLADVPALEES